MSTVMSILGSIAAMPDIELTTASNEESLGIQEKRARKPKQAKKVKTPKGKTENVKKDVVYVKIVSPFTCKKTDGKQWQCKRPDMPNSFCNYHFEKRRFYDKKKTKAPASMTPSRCNQAARKTATTPAVADHCEDSVSEAWQVGMAKAKGKEKPAASTQPEEVEKVTGDDVPAKTEPVKMEVEETTLDADKPEDVEQPDEEKEVNENGTFEAAMNTDTPADEKVEEGDTKQETKGDESTKKASNKKGKRIRERKRAAADAGGSTSTADKSTDLEKKGLMKPESKGLIFMCNAKTKEECFARCLSTCT